MNTATATPFVHEIAAAHDARLTHTASWARQLGVVLAIAAAFSVFSGAYLPAILEIMSAVWLVRASKDLRAIVSTAGNDVPLLLAATDRLARMLNLRIMMTLIAIPVLLVGMISGMLAR